MLTHNKPAAYKSLGYKSIDITDRLPEFLEKHSDIPILMLILLGKQKGASYKDYASLLKNKYGTGKVKNGEVFDANGRLKYLNRFLYNDYRSSVRDAQNYLKPNSYSGNPSDYIVKTSGRKQSESDNANSYIEQIKKIIKNEGRNSPRIQSLDNIPNSNHFESVKRDIISAQNQETTDQNDKIADQVDRILEDPSKAGSDTIIVKPESITQEDQKLLDQIENLIDEKNQLHQ